MANKSSIATAYVQILPSADGIKANLEEQFDKAGSSSGSFFLGSLGKTVAAGAAAALSAGAAAVGSLVRSAVQAYADYEQLIGGVETLFGDAADAVSSYANNAFASAGLSANDYMETVTSFAASLVSSLGGDTAAAATAANMAITDMADNANKMGTDIESIQNAYQGFAKQNYTMLDNLKLGYGGTKEEMQRLLDTADELNAAQGIYTDYQIANYADIVEAIHVVQDSMGIAGATAAEASTTIQGSFSALKASWENTLVGLAGGGEDFDILMGNLVTSAITFGENILPVVEAAILGVGALIEGLLPEVVNMVPQLVIEVLPGLLDAASKLITGFIETLVSAMPEIFNTGVEAVAQLVTAISVNLPTLIPMAVEAVMTLSSGLIENLPTIVDAGIQLLGGLVTGLLNAIPQMVTQIPQIIASIKTSFISAIPQLKETGYNMLMGLKQGFLNAVSSLISAALGVAQSIINSIKNFLGIHSPSTVMENLIGENMMLGWAEGIDENASLVSEAIDDVAASTTSSLEQQIGVAADVGSIALTGDSGSGVIVSAINDLMDKLDRLAVYLDGDLLVGGIIDAVDKQLEDRSIMAGRGVMV